MSELKKLAVGHPYYCSESNYYSNDASETYETMTEFLEEWENADVHMNWCFRWDVSPRGENGAEAGRYRAEVFIMLQRKGIFKPIQIKHFNENEVTGFKAYIEKHWSYTKDVWEPLPTQTQEPPTEGDE